MVRATFRLTVPESLYDAVCREVDQPFADSYLTGATLAGTVITPRTLTGYRKMLDRADFRNLMQRLGMTLAQPTPLTGEDGRLTAKDCMW